MPTYFAHTPPPGSKKWHRLLAHLVKTGKRARSAARNSQEARLLYFTGLLHDLGKYQNAFQSYLHASHDGTRHDRVPHAMLGAKTAYDLGVTEAAFAIAGHHMGIPNRSDLSSRYFPGLIELPEDPATLQARLEIDLRRELKTLLPGHAGEADPFIFDTRVRFLFSCLVDADWLDSERHFDRKRSIHRKPTNLDIPRMQGALQTRFAALPQTGPLNQLRTRVRNAALSRAGLQPGFFSLILPTGLGKTLTSVAWALEHARIHSLKRIIIVLPYTNIIDQTALELKKIFGVDRVLEHHSNVILDSREENDEDGAPYDARKLATENWDHPLIITTTVQFFESLFGNRPSRCRKLHNIANAVVIFDEVQTLPKESILPTLRMLENVQGVFQTSFLFSTATMPAFEKREGFQYGLSGIVPLIPDSATLTEQTRRASFDFINELQPISTAELIAHIEEKNGSRLIICNAKKDALNIYNGIQHGYTQKYHLSTSMCPAHRKTILKWIRRQLKAGQNILLVSTQLVEAGVDIDFPVVYRALAPLDSLIQAAGRCNREGSLPEPGQVFIYCTEKMGMPLDQSYQTATEWTRVFLKSTDPDLLKSEVYSEYFSTLLRNFINADKAGVHESRRQLQFKDVAEHYKVIDSPTQAVYIHSYNERSKHLYQRIRNKPYLSSDDRRQLQQYSVQLYPSLLQKAQSSGYLHELQNGLTVWHGRYRNDTGLQVEPDEMEFIV